MIVVNKNNIFNQRGQSLLELIVAMTIINIGLFAVWALFLSNFGGEQEAKARILGSNLAKEGVEAVKNIRDSNWLKLENNDNCGAELCAWDYGLVDPAGDATAILVDMFGEGSQPKLDFIPDSLDDPKTKIFISEPEQGEFFVQYPSEEAPTGKTTIYRRLITLTGICCLDNDNDGACDNSELKNCSDGGNLRVGLDVSSRVRWEVQGKRREVVVEDQIFNWK